jgi:hypothetical protein
MKIVFCSAFRNAVHSVPVYFRQMAGLYFLLTERGDEPYLLLGEGDSTDHTREALTEAMQQTGFGGKIINCTHGGRRYGHVINRKRFAQLASVYNWIWAHIPKEDVRAVVFLEGDLLWEPAQMFGLIEAVREYGAVAPMIFDELPDADGRKLFYDSWGYVADGVNFVKPYPYHPHVNGHPIPLDSAGSCIAMTADAARRVHFPPDDMVVGMTKLLAANGNPVWLQPTLEVRHPDEP